MSPNGSTRPEMWNASKTARELGIVVRERRHELGMTQQQLADLARVGRTWLVAVEAGHQRAELDKVLSVLSVLDLTLDVSPEVGTDVDLDALLDRHRQIDDRG
jgi:y4mF family transcriptional regulator